MIGIFARTCSNWLTAFGVSPKSIAGQGTQQQRLNTVSLVEIVIEEKQIGQGRGEIVDLRFCFHLRRANSARLDKTVTAASSFPSARNAIAWK